MLTLFLASIVKINNRLRPNASTFGIICRKASKRIRIKRFFGACPFLFFDSFNLPRDQNEICKLVSYTMGYYRNCFRTCSNYNKIGLCGI